MLALRLLNYQRPTQLPELSGTGVSGVETYKIDGSNAVVSITNSADLSAILSSIASGLFNHLCSSDWWNFSYCRNADTLNMLAGLGSQQPMFP